MNEKQPYEQHLADKLQHLPPPADINRSWEKMRKLLDDEMPRGGGFGGGRNRWWIAGIITGILILGTWLADSQLSQTNKKTQPAVAATSNTAKEKETKNAKTVTLPGNKTSQNTKTGQPATGNTSTEQDIAAGNPVNNDVVTGNETVKNNKAPATTKPVQGNNGPAINDQGTVTNNRQVAASNKKETNDKNLLVNNSKGTETKNNNSQTGNKTTTIPGSINNPVSGVNRSQQQQTGDNEITGNNKRAAPVKKEEELVINASTVNKTSIGGLIITPAAGITKDYSAIAAKDLFPESELQKKKALAKNRSSNMGKGRVDHSFAVGLSLPLAFPLGDQKALSYNRNAGVNTVSDYLPSPHLQYHFNDKTYLQTEVQLMNPQYIRPILLYQQKEVVPSTNYYIYNSVYAKKLYYFNIPVAIHHSPFKNFYLGTGVQFSTLLSGVALYEERKQGSGQSILLHEQYTRFNNDSLSNRFNGTEMRLLLDVNYYFNRFTVGLRYNQAFSNYVSFRLNNTSGYTFDKNKALQFYLRYNLWEDLKRKKPATSFLSLK